MQSSARHEVGWVTCLFRTPLCLEERKQTHQSGSLACHELQKGQNTQHSLVPPMFPVTWVFSSLYVNVVSIIVHHICWQLSWANDRDNCLAVGKMRHKAITSAKVFIPLKHPGFMLHVANYNLRQALHSKSSTWWALDSTPVKAGTKEVVALWADLHPPVQYQDTRWHTVLPIISILPMSAKKTM